MFNNIFSFQGRLSRKHFNISLIFIVAAGSLVYLAYTYFFPNYYFLAIALAPIVYVLLAQMAKRLHDLGYPSWFVILAHAVFMCMIRPRQEGANKYGPEPLN